MKLRKWMEKNHLLHCSDSYHQWYALPVTVMNQRKRGRQVALGCSFNMDRNDLAALTEIVNFVYGDSHRWALSGRSNRSRSVSTVGGVIADIEVGIYRIRGQCQRGFVSYFRCCPWMASSSRFEIVFTVLRRNHEKSYIQGWSLQT